MNLSKHRGSHGETHGRFKTQKSQNEINTRHCRKYVAVAQTMRVLILQFQTHKHDTQQRFFQQFCQNTATVVERVLQLHCAIWHS